MALAITELNKRNIYFDQKIMTRLTSSLGSFEEQENTVVSEKEHETLKLIGQGLKPVEIGERLHCSKHAVITYKHNLFQKFSVITIEELVKKAVLGGYIKE